MKGPSGEAIGDNGAPANGTSWSLSGNDVVCDPETWSESVFSPGSAAEESETFSSCEAACGATWEAEEASGAEGTVFSWEVESSGAGQQWL